MQSISYSEVKNLLKAYKNKFFASFTQQEKDLFDEFLNNLNDINEINKEIVSVIARLIPQEHYAPDRNDIVTFGPFKLRLQRANPNIPIRLDNVTIPYERSDRPFVKSNKALEGKLERLTKQYYQIAHRMIKIAEKLPSLSSFKCNSISIIRNQLIEHPENKASGVTYDTFAYSLTEGPYIKGLRRGNQTQYMDKGFKTNSEEFIRKLSEVLINIIKP